MNDVINPRYKEEKAIAAACRLLELSGGQCDKYWLNKVMYYIERQSLIESGQPIFFDKLYSIRYGPIVSAINDGIDMAGYPYQSPWSISFTLEGNNIVLQNKADDAVLSNFDIHIINDAFEKFKGWDFEQMKNYFHKLPEHKTTLSREEIQYEDILKSEGLDPQSIENIIEEIDYLGCLENSLDGAR